MKLKWAAVAGLILLGLIPAVASADGIDPTVTIGRGGASLQTTQGASQADPLIVMDGSGVSDFEYVGETALSALYVEVIPSLGPSGSALFLGEFWNCAPGIAGACFSVSPTQLPAVEFAFLGSQGFITPGTHFTVSAVEPDTLVLLLVGGVFALGFALIRKRRLLA